MAYDRTKNLVPFKKGEDPRRNTKGIRYGNKNLASIIRELENENFDWDVLPTRHNPQLKKIIEQIAPMGSPWRAITMKLVIEALQGNVKAAEWLRKSGYGDTLDVTSQGESIAPKIVSEIKPHVKPQTETEPSDRTDQ